MEALAEIPRVMKLDSAIYLNAECRRRASYVPARRAANVEPLTALRQD